MKWCVVPLLRSCSATYFMQISADSATVLHHQLVDALLTAQVYRGLDIGASKPDAILRTAVPHRTNMCFATALRRTQISLTLLM